RPARRRPEDRRLLPRRVLRAVRPVPRRHGAPGGDRRAPRRRPPPREPRGGGRAPRRDRPRDEGRLDLRPRPDGVGRRPVGDAQARGLPRRTGPLRRLDPSRPVTLTIDGRETTVPAGTTILEACRAQEIDTPTLCFLENLTPINVCRVCVVEVEGSRVLVPACSRPAEAER